MECFGWASFACHDGCVIPVMTARTRTGHHAAYGAGSLRRGRSSRNGEGMDAGQGRDGVLMEIREGAESIFPDKP
ncbi:hypothetical protein CFR72_12585 [Gluconacetobacter entanii]|uniref:Uncharacterized protein n=1 Tax=Gluconacetobacter entanii TaxID=108528 RepID=A0A318Q0K3_9PROT|nr:hypothetical protein CFR72_12585 [Gluconacetobacter entanii]